MILKVLYYEDYVNMLRVMKIQDSQETLKFDIILKINSDTLSS